MYQGPLRCVWERQVKHTNFFYGMRTTEPAEVDNMRLGNFSASGSSPLIATSVRNIVSPKMFTIEQAGLARLGITVSVSHRSTPGLHSVYQWVYIRKVIKERSQCWNDRDQCRAEVEN